MVRLPWDSIGTVGIEPLDQDHQQMALLINALAGALEDGAAEDARRLARLLGEHFDSHSLRERRLFIAGSPAGDLRHARIADRLGRLREALDRGGGGELLDGIADDLMEEIEDDAVLVKAMCGQALDLAERRRYLRFRVAMAVAARLADGVAPAELVDISRGGCLFVEGTELDANVGQEVALEVMGGILPGVVVAAGEQGYHVRFNEEVDSERMAHILLHAVLEPQPMD